MKISYHEFLPSDFYYPLLVKRVWGKLEQGENVLVGGMYGCGIHTFLNVFSLWQEKDGVMKADYYAAEDGVEELKRWVKGRMGESGRRALVIHGFEKVSQKRSILEWLYLQQLPRLADTVYLVVADHSAVTEPESYLALTGTFFGERLEIGPFDLGLTTRLIKLNAEFFGWDVPEEKYRVIHELTGGVQRLAKHVCRLMSEKGVHIEEVERFVEDPSILFQLNLMVKIISTCTADHLSKLGITGEFGRIKSGLVAQYWKNYQNEVVGQLFPDLSRLESRVFSVLYENRGKVMPLEKIGDVLELEGSEFSLWAIYKLISRLKLRIERNFRIVTVKGRGYLLEQKVQ